MKKKIIFLLFLIGTFLFASNLGDYKIPSFITDKFSEKESAISESKSDAAIEVKNESEGTKLFSADIEQGIIGINSLDEVDDAYDNVFHLKIDELPQADENAYLEYD